MIVSIVQQFTAIIHTLFASVIKLKRKLVWAFIKLKLFTGTLCMYVHKNAGQVAEGSTLDHMTHVGTKCRRESLLQSQLVSSPLSQDYLQWKERVLASARAKLASQK